MRHHHAIPRTLATGARLRLGTLVLLLLLLPAAGAGAGSGPNGGPAQAVTPGTMLAWGEDGSGQLGDSTVGSPLSNPAPKAVPGLSGIVAVSAGVSHTLALKEDGTV